MSSWFDKREVSLCLVLALLAAALACGAWAGKITEDPNVSGKAAAAEEQEHSKDERVAQKITYEARKKRVVEILDDLSEMSGVTLKAGASNQDWQVRDRRMNIFAKDLPLAHLMNSIARLMKFRWNKSDDEAPTYRLFMDTRTRLAAEARLRQEDSAREQRDLERRQKAWEQFSKCANLTPDEIEKLKQENPFLYVCASSGLANSLSSFLTQSPAVADALMAGQTLALGAQALSPAGQQALVAVMTDMLRLENRLGGRRRPLTGEILNDAASITIDVNTRFEHMRQAAGNSMMLGEMTMRYSRPDGSQKSVDLPLIDPNSSMAKMIGKMLVRAEEQGRSPEDVVRESHSEMDQAFAADTGNTDMGEAAPQHPDDPDLAKKVKLDATSPQLDEALAALSKASGFAVVSDSFGRLMFRAVGSYEKEGDLRAVLESVGEAFRSNWEKHGAVIEFRDKEWYRKRAALIPEAWLEEWRSKLRKDGTLDIPDLARMTALTTDQFSVYIASDDVLRICVSALLAAREALKTYAVLNESQRQMVFTESGLDLRAVLPEQWGTVEKCIQSRNSAFLLSPEARLTLFGSRSPDGRAYHYSFRLTTSEGLPEITWSVTTPRYAPPLQIPENEPAKGKAVDDVGKEK